MSASPFNNPEPQEIGVGTHMPTYPLPYNELNSYVNCEDLSEGNLQSNLSVTQAGCM